MKRELQGHYVTISTVGEKARAFVPASLPPKPPIEWTPDCRSPFSQSLMGLWLSSIEKQHRPAGEVTGEVERLLRVLHGEMKRVELQKALDLRHEDYFREAYLVPALDAGLVEMTIPDKPRSSKQKYRLTAKGRKHLRHLDEGGE
ncbi:MAG: Fic family protein [Nitrospinota bacterium]